MRLIYCLFLLASCSSQELDQPEFGMERYLHKEAENMKLYPFSSLNGIFTSKVLGLGLAKIVRSDPLKISFDVPLGRFPVNCQVSMVVGGGAHELKTKIDDALSQYQIDQLELTKFDSGFFFDKAYINADYSYYLNSKDGKLFGYLKAYLLSINGRSLVCVHDEVGFRESFRKMMKSIAKTFEFLNDAKPIEHEIFLVNYLGKRIGFNTDSHRWLKSSN